ncbi:leucine-rich repeat domain-containing protein [Reichenbachiella versicolor]|uniref:leucine-rich repeat domain-containing protein n=1 Tax=Reichenbachiella versicolor TaxID=1821036 RepID=UPI000D6E9F31|nr:leucine-rich repeat domain-containing protein [Reichenbachiella versicolor]
MKAIQEIEAILGVKLEEQSLDEDQDQKSLYYIRKEELRSLDLYGVTIEDFTPLVPYLQKLESFKLTNSTIQNFSELLKFNCFNLQLDNVTFQNSNCDTIGRMPGHVICSNMSLDASCLACHQQLNYKRFRQVEFTNCHIDNIQEMDDLEDISLLILNNITFTHSPKRGSKGTTRRLTITDTSFDDISFLPFAHSLKSIEVTNCQIGSISGLTHFPSLGGFAIDSDTIIEDQSILENKSGKKIGLALEQGEKPLDLIKLSPFKNHIDRLEIHKFTEQKLEGIDTFQQVKKLYFQDSNVHLEAFLPIAQQIESISLSSSTVQDYSYIQDFASLIDFSVSQYGDEDEALEIFPQILPLKNQLKSLDIYESEGVKSPHLIREFTALESLVIAFIDGELVSHILTLQNLKRLSLMMFYEEGTFSLENLKNLEYLKLETDVTFTGFEHLKKLKSLKIGDSTDSPTIDFNMLPEMKNLKRLNLVSYDYEINGFDQFPNLEYLQLKGSAKVTLGKLEHLKVLSLENANIENFSTFEEQPNLESLDLSNIVCKLDLKEIDKFPNLKKLTFMESEVTDISALEPLKKLEYLDLLGTEVKDVRVLNTLPNFKGANLAVWGQNDLASQLDNPNVAAYAGFHPVYLWIWEEDEFGI